MKKVENCSICKNYLGMNPKVIKAIKAGGVVYEVIECPVCKNHLERKVK